MKWTRPPQITEVKPLDLWNSRNPFLWTDKLKKHPISLLFWYVDWIFLLNIWGSAEELQCRSLMRWSGARSFTPWSPLVFLVEGIDSFGIIIINGFLSHFSHYALSLSFFHVYLCHFVFSYINFICIVFIFVFVLVFAFVFISEKSLGGAAWLIWLPPCIVC